MYAKGVMALFYVKGVLVNSETILDRLPGAGGPSGGHGLGGGDDQGRVGGGGPSGGGGAGEAAGLGGGPSGGSGMGTRRSWDLQLRVCISISVSWWWCLALDATCPPFGVQAI